MPPYVQLFNFLSESERLQLLEWTLTNRTRFKPAKVTKGRVDSKARLDPQQRIALTTGKIAPIDLMLRPRLINALPEVIAKTGTGGPTPGSLELELAAQGDGAHFAPHLDISIGPNRKPLGGTTPLEDRVVSAVYYYHAEPKAFSGGNLRLYRFGAEPNDSVATNHIDIEPVQNSLVAFPSWVVHEVRRVSCPSGNFGDFRFALNCWYCRAL